MTHIAFPFKKKRLNPFDNQSHQLGTDLNNCYLPCQPLDSLKHGEVHWGYKMKSGFMLCEEVFEVVYAEVKIDNYFTVFYKISLLHVLMWWLPVCTFLSICS